MHLKVLLSSLAECKTEFGKGANVTLPYAKICFIIGVAILCLVESVFEREPKWLDEVLSK